MKLFSASLISLVVVLPFGSVSADGMGRMHGYAQPPGVTQKTFVTTDAIVVDENKKFGNHGRLSAYDKSHVAPTAKIETMPVLAGMRLIKAAKKTGGFGRLNGYNETLEKGFSDFFDVLDTSNIAVWY